MKKVLSTALAGAMVLGMSTAAFAATESLTLKPSKNTNYAYSLNLYQPEGQVINGQWIVDDPEAVKSAFDTYVSATKTMKKYSLNDVEEGKLYTTRDLKRLCDSATSLYQTLTVAERALIGMPSDVNAGTYTNAYTIGASEMGSGTYSNIDNIYHGVTGLDKAQAPYWDPNGWTLDNLKNSSIGKGQYVGNSRDYVDITAAPNEHHMYTYGTDDAKEVKFEVVVKYDEDFRVDVASGKVTVSRKRTEHNKLKGYDTYLVTVKANAGVRDFELDDWKVELDLHSANRVYYIQGDVSYSDYRDVEPDGRYIIKKSNKDDAHDDGSIFNFDQVIDVETRIVTGEYCDMLFKGNYGTDFENLRVVTSEVKEVEDFFGDYDIDYYTFVGTPKFAKDVTCRIDADADAYIYEFDPKTGDVVDITDECDYQSDGMTFKRKVFKTYVVLEEPYAGGNTKVDKDMITEKEPKPSSESSDSANQSKKPNPGTGAYPA